ncbi:MAG: peptidoglycan DD-metalloendopeptidase family protein [Deltaproteobacteria bacterium]|nr:peptidoglycan DD-metalloendopeptidase family protein [Deltaproteobacteria bacterium]NCP03405.1 peptidoglycan DD-metalloendopeptidase family protein [Deltaproteobacteria bacterium]
MNHHLPQDFQPPRGGQHHAVSRRPRRVLPLVIFLASLALVGVLLFGPSYPDLQAQQSPPVEISAPVPRIPVPERQEIAALVASGDTLTSLLGEFFTPQEIQIISQQSKNVFPVSAICAGQPYKICTTDKRFEQFIYEIDAEEQLIIRRDADSFQVERAPIVYDVQTELVRGQIDSSLFEAVTKLGESSELAMTLANIFAWDIDFVRDLRQGDSFSVLVEKRYREGKQTGYGKVLAADFRNNGELYRAFYFRDAEGVGSYYDEAGNSLRKAFLKAPLEFSRISSGYTNKRFHPITKSWKAHPAIDYAAAKGTPIKTVGDGTILRIGYTSGNGNFIEVRHNGGYKTMYLHMSRFAKGMSRGKRLSQGQVIGYVGSTGLATGPHLCFRMKRNDAPVNPYKVKAPAAKPVSTASMPLFQQQVAALRRELDRRNPQQTAQLQAPVN